MKRDSFTTLAVMLCGAYGVVLAGYFVQLTAAVSWLPSASAWPMGSVPNALYWKCAILLFMVVSTYRAMRRQIMPHRWKRRLYQICGWVFLLFVLIAIILDLIATDQPMGPASLVLELVRLILPAFVLAMGYGLSMEAKRRKTRYFENLGISPA